MAVAVGYDVEVVDPLPPGARKGSFLYELQSELATIHRDIFPDGQNFNGMIQNGWTMARNDLCRINAKAAQKQQSLIFGVACKAAFVDLYNKGDDKCGGVFCDVLNWARENSNSLLASIIEATTDEEAFRIIEDEIINPIMEYNCKCSMKMMDAWMGCKGDIGEASIWLTLQTFGGFNTTAEYLGESTWKDYWVDVLVNQVPWDDISNLLERTMANLCQDNAQGEEQCYSYFYNTAITMYQWYLTSSGLKPSVNPRDRNRARSDYDESCSSFDLSLVDEDDASFDDIKDALVDKFCFDECSGLYQDVLLGCCTASMIKDEVLEGAVKNTAEGIKDIYVNIYANETDLAGSMIDEYFGYYDNVMGMLRDPTCDNGVSYDVIPCDQVEADPCEGLRGKKLEKCEKENEEPCEGDDCDPCEGLKGKKLKKCEKENKPPCEGDDCDPCEGLKGKKLKKCEKKNKPPCEGDDCDPCEGLKGKKKKKCKKDNNNGGGDGGDNCEGLKGKKKKKCLKKLSEEA